MILFNSIYSHDLRILWSAFDTFLFDAEVINSTKDRKCQESIDGSFQFPPVLPVSLAIFAFILSLSFFETRLFATLLPVRLLCKFLFKVIIMINIVLVPLILLHLLHMFQAFINHSSHASCFLFLLDLFKSFVSLLAKFLHLGLLRLCQVVFFIFTCKCVD